MQHLISADEAVAILGASGAPDDLVQRFARQLEVVLGARRGFGPDGMVTCYSVAGARSGHPGVNIDMERVTAIGETIGFVDVHMPGSGVRLQLDIKSAYKVATNLLGAAEAAISDMTVFRLLTEKVGIEAAQAGRMLVDLRELRQGSRDTVLEQ